MTTFIAKITGSNSPAKRARRAVKQARREIGRHRVTVDPANGINDLWSKADGGSRITVTPGATIRPDSKVFAMGSCFAREIRAALRAQGVDVYPKYFDIPFDPAKVMLNQLPVRDNVNHYDTFNIRQEFERALGLSTVDYPMVEVAPGAAPKALDGRGRFQDPYRSNILAVDLDSTQQISDAISDAIRTAVLAADLYIVTLGMIEAWRDRETGLHVWGEQVGRYAPDPTRFELHRATYQENYENVAWICRTIAERYPDRKILLTVSPVPIGRTFTDEDVVVANSYTKGQLRAVAGQINMDFDNVIYWPSYEMALRADLFRADGRHVTEEGVRFVIENLLAAHAVH